MLFGISKKTPDVNVNVVNLVLSLARRSIFMRRNLAFYEGKVLDLGIFLQMQYKAFFKLYFSDGVDFFEGNVMGGNTLFTITEGGKLQFNF